MTRIELTVYQDPGQADVICQVRRKDGTFEPITATVDTGAQISLLPAAFMEILDYTPVRSAPVSIQQAGLAEQNFNAIEARITVFLEDMAGNQTEKFEILVWFAGARYPLVGFGGILERARLVLDMPHLAGYLEFATP